MTKLWLIAILSCASAAALALSIDLDVGEHRSDAIVQTEAS